MKLPQKIITRNYQKLLYLQGNVSTFLEHLVYIFKYKVVKLEFFKVHYTYYNEKFGKDGFHEMLDWNECNEEIEKFYKEYILKYIIDTEISDKVYPSRIYNI